MGVIAAFVPIVLVVRWLETHGYIRDETGLVHSIAKIIGPGGRAITCEFRGETQGNLIEVMVREAFLAESPSN